MSVFPQDLAWRRAPDLTLKRANKLERCVRGRPDDVPSGRQCFWNPEPVLAGRSLCPECAGLPVLCAVVRSASRITGGI